MLNQSNVDDFPFSPTKTKEREQKKKQCKPVGVTSLLQFLSNWNAENESTYNGPLHIFTFIYWIPTFNPGFDEQITFIHNIY